MKIIVTGSLAFDQIMNFPDEFAQHIMADKLHVMSVSFLIQHLHKNFGGTAGNISYNLGLLGLETICLACVGKDAQDYKTYLEKNGVNTDYITTIATDYTASSVVITDKKDCQITGFYPGALTHDRDLAIEEVMEHEKIEVGSAFLVVAPTLPEAMVKYVHTAREKGIRYLFSPAQQIPRLSKDDLRAGIEGAEVLIGNDYEMAQLEQRSGMNKKDILEHVNVVVTTLADRGSCIEQKGKEEIMIGVARPREIKDPTGSGDAYIAGFLAAYTDGKSLVECGQWGATASVYAVEAYGTTGHSYSMSLFENRLRENFGRF